MTRSRTRSGGRSGCAIHPRSGQTAAIDKPPATAECNFQAFCLGRTGPVRVAGCGPRQRPLSGWARKRGFSNGHSSGRAADSVHAAVVPVFPGSRAPPAFATEFVEDFVICGYLCT